MEAKINIAEILRNKPHGIKLYSPIFGDCTYCYIQGETSNICVKRQYNVRSYFNFEGLYNADGECLLFPSKEMRDWSKFTWKKGDVLVSNNGKIEVIFEKFGSDTYQSFIGKHHLDSLDENLYYQDGGAYPTASFNIETEDAAQTYINTIEERLDGKLNHETLEIEKTQPEFKDGDILSCDEDSYTRHTTLILHKDENITESIVSLVRHKKLIKINAPIDNFLLSRLYPARKDEKKELFDALAKEGKQWDSGKKMIIDLKPKWIPKPFDKVLVRDSKSSKWRANLFSHKNIDEPYYCVYSRWNYCIPYEGNESLLGTTKNVEVSYGRSF